MNFPLRWKFELIGFVFYKMQDLEESKKTLPQVLILLYVDEFAI